MLFKDQDEISRDQLAVLNRARAEITHLVEEREDWLWHMVLTVATAAYGLRFNQAALFLLERETNSLRGHLGIGQFSHEKARRIWLRDHQKPRDFGEYLEQLRAGRLRSTEVDDAVRGMIIDLNSGGAFTEVFREGQRRILYAKQAEVELPSVFMERFSKADYALLPLRTDKMVLGLLMVNNIHNGLLLQPIALSHLETLLTQGALSLQAHRRQQSLEAILNTANDLPLKDILDKVCRMALEETGADRVLIYPLKPGALSYEFDTPNRSHADAAPGLPPVLPPEQGGITEHILRSGMLAVPAKKKHHSLYAGRPLMEHPTIHEGIEAFIGLRVQEPGKNTSLGVLYLIYKKARDGKFTTRELDKARYFSHLAAAPIRIAWSYRQRRTDRVSDGAEEKHREEKHQSHELKVLKAVLQEVLTSDEVLREALLTASRSNRNSVSHSEYIDLKRVQDKLIRTLLQAASDLVQRPQARAGLLLLDWENSEDPGEGSVRVRREYYRNSDGSIGTNNQRIIYNGISGKALKECKSLLVPDVTQGEHASNFYNDNIVETKSELDVPLKIGQYAIGVFNLESPELEAFNNFHQESIQRLADFAALALRNLERQIHLCNVLIAARKVAASSDLEATLHSILQVARDVAPGLSALTIWYREPAGGRIVLGPYFGVDKPNGMKSAETVQGTVVWNVMYGEKPVWATDVEEVTALAGRFVDEEHIKSVAAIPLLMKEGSKTEKVGAIFFNYREPHEFTDEEKFLFPLLSEIAAASIWDAAYLDLFRTHSEMTKVVGTTLDLDSASSYFLGILRSRFPGATPYVLIYNQADEVLEFSPGAKYEVDNPDAPPLRTLTKEHKSLVNFAANMSIKSGKVEALNIENVQDHPQYVRHILSTNSQLCITLMADEQLLGVLAVERPESEAFSHADKSFAQEVAHMMSIVIHGASQAKKLGFQSNIAAALAWAAEIAHDLKNPIADIRDRAYWLRNEKCLSPEGRQFIEQLDELAGQLADTVERADPDRPLQSSNCLLDKWLKERIPALIAQRSAVINCNFQLGCEGIEIETDPFRLAHALRHIVRNASAAMPPPQGGTLTVRTSIYSKQWVEVQIKDTGPGIRPELRPFILNQRIQSWRGTGSGLMLARYSIESIGGTIQLLPPVIDEGAAFAIRLPLKAYT